MSIEERIYDILSETGVTDDEMKALIALINEARDDGYLDGVQDVQKHRNVQVAERCAAIAQRAYESGHEAYDNIQKIISEVDNDNNLQDIKEGK